MVYSFKEEDFNKAWEKMKNEFPDQGEIIAYLEAQWLPVKKEWAKCYINQYLNFGARTTSPTESAHRDLKSYLISGKSNLYRLHEVAETMIQNKETWFTQEVDRQAQRQRTKFGGQAWLGSTPREVSYEAIDMIAKQKRLAQGAIPSQLHPFPPRLQPCTGRFQAQYGLPCSHKILEVLEGRAEERTIQKADCHPF